MTGPQPTLLLVDDEADILVALEDLFEGRYRILSATAPADALTILSREPDVAVIISDQRMPGMAGDAFLTQARTISDANAILLTGYADLSAVTAALNRGGIVGYVPKPWEPDALRAMVATAAEQHRLSRALREEQALLRGLMEHLPYSVAFKNADGRFVHVNARKAEALGLSPEESVGVSEELMSEGERAALASAKPVQVVEEIGAAAGQQRWIQTDYVPLTGPTGSVEHVVVMERDITEQKHAEMQLRQTDKLRALGTLAGGVAHDFNNLLTAIVGSLELATRRIGDEAAVRRYLDNATVAAQRGASLTQRLLGFSRRSDAEPATVAIGPALRSMADLLARTLGGAVVVDWQVPDDLWSSSVEQDQLELGILNLAINARDAMPEGGGITISGRNARLAEPRPKIGLEAGDYVVVTVSDNGEGMSPEIVERVLEPFFTTKPVGKGTGLGLPMVYGFAQRSGGTLEIRSEAGSGTQVSIYLPRATAEDRTAPSGGRGASEEAGDWRKGCILVIDDEPGVRSVTAACLRDLGHEVYEAADGPSGLTLLQEKDRSIELAIVDFAMPGMNGVDFSLAARAQRPRLPVILLTGYFDVEAVPNDIIVMHKPFTNATLQSAVAAALGAMAPAES